MKLLTAGTTTEPSNVLGRGLYGLAIALDSKTVVKFTTSEAEYLTAQKLQGRRFKHVWSVYACGECNADTLTVVRDLARRCGRKNAYIDWQSAYISWQAKVYWIIGERLSKPKHESGRVKAFRRYGAAAQRFEKAVNEELAAAFGWSVQHHDVHGGNVLLRNGRKMVAFDVQ